jgi:hypothetical protein
MAVRDEVSDAPSEDKPSDNLLLSLAQDHLALLVPIIGALIFAFRCIVVSEGDPYVASILVAETSIGDAIRALFFTVIPTLLFLVAYVIGFAVARRIASGRLLKLSTLGMGIAIVAVSFGWAYFSGNVGMVDPQILTLFALSTILISLPMARELVLRQRRKQQQQHTSRMEDVGGLALIALSTLGLAFMAFVVLGATLGDRTFWLPRERLVFKNEEPFTGHVLKVSEDQLMILNDEPRIIIQRNKDALEDRDFCYPEDHKARSSKIASDSPACP